MSATKMRNIGPKSAAWLRQVGLRTLDDLAAVGTVDAFMRVKRAGFKPGLNLLYAIEGALLDCHWQDVPEDRRHELILAAEAATALLPPPRNRPAAGPVTTTMSSHNGNGSGDHEASELSGGDFESGHGADNDETSHADDGSSAANIRGLSGRWGQQWGVPEARSEPAMAAQTGASMSTRKVNARRHGSSRSSC